MKSAYLNAGLNNLVAQQYTGETACVDLTSLDVLRNRLDEVLNYVSEQGARLESIEAKLHGERGETKSAGGTPRAVPCGVLAEMGEKLDEIMFRLQRTDEVVSRMRSAI